MNLESSLALTPPLLTSEIPGIAGRIKSAPEDFEVEEIAAYEPCGTGDFLYLWLEKRGMGAEYFTRQVARRLGIGTSEVGAAGLKDRHAVTRQWVSVPAGVESQLPQLEGDGITVLRVDRHTNKLRSGHLRGNRFRIVIRDIGPDVDAPSSVSSVVEKIRAHGLPNFYGPQRFGKDGETLQHGLDLFGGRLAGAEGSDALATRSRVRSPFLRKLALSAVQSALFNDYLARRMSGGLLRRVLPGDVMAKWPFGGMFVAEDVVAEQVRFDCREIVSAGPIFGRKTFPAKTEAAEREAAVLAAAGLSRSSFTGFGKLLEGSRRHNLVYVEDLVASLQLDTVQLTFSLPAGSYATVLLREVMKTKTTDDEASREE